MSRGRRSEPAPPRAPWGSFPLSELLVLLAVVLGIYGVLSWGTQRAVWSIAGATALGCLAGLEVAVREHFSGHRPHSTLLGGTAAAVAAAAAFLLRAPLTAVFITAVAAFVLAAALFARAFGRPRSP